MFKKNSVKLILLGALAVVGISSCQKEEVLMPAADNGSNDNKTVIFIRAVDKDSSVVESQQLLLR